MSIKPFVVMILSGIMIFITIKCFPNWEFTRSIALISLVFLIGGYFRFLIDFVVNPYRG